MSVPLSSVYASPLTKQLQPSARAQDRAGERGRAGKSSPGTVTCPGKGTATMSSWGQQEPSLLPLLFSGGAWGHPSSNVGEENPPGLTLSHPEETGMSPAGAGTCRTGQHLPASPSSHLELAALLFPSLVWEQGGSDPATPGTARECRDQELCLFCSFCPFCPFCHLGTPPDHADPLEGKGQMLALVALV